MILTFTLGEFVLLLTLIGGIIAQHYMLKIDFERKMAAILTMTRKEMREEIDRSLEGIDAEIERVREIAEDNRRRADEMGREIERIKAA